MREDDAKSGVGAQRGGGLHKAYIKSIPTKEGALSPSLKRSPSQASSEGSTTSDFFAEHFPRVSRFAARSLLYELTFPFRPTALLHSESSQRL